METKTVLLTSKRDIITNALIKLRYLILDIKHARFLHGIYTTTTDTPSPEMEYYKMNTDNSVSYLAGLSDSYLAEKIFDYLLLADTAELLGEKVRPDGGSIEDMLDYRTSIPRNSIFCIDPIKYIFDIVLNHNKFVATINIRGRLSLVDASGETRSKCISRGEPSYKVAKKSYVISTFVAKHYLGAKPSGYRVIHLNGNRSDYRPSNLKYVLKDTPNSCGKDVAVDIDGDK